MVLDQRENDEKCCWLCDETITGDDKGKGGVGCSRFCSPQHETFFIKSEQPPVASQEVRSFTDFEDNCFPQTERKGGCSLVGVNGEQQKEKIYFPIKVAESPDKGRYLEASTNIKAGEVIFHENRPLIWGAVDNTSLMCTGCFKLISGLERCQQCDFPICSTTKCPHLNTHLENECAIFKDKRIASIVREMTASTVTRGGSELRHSATINNWLVMMVRILVHIDTFPSSKSKDILQRMVSHRDKQRNEDRDLVVEIILNHCGYKSTYSKSLIEHVMGVISVNSVRIRLSTCKDDQSEEIHHQSQSMVANNNNAVTCEYAEGFAVYPLTSLINHSCFQPNIKTVILKSKTNSDQRGYKLRCIATRDIKCGEMLTKDYVDVWLPTHIRQQKLMDGWHFRCECCRCVDPNEMGLNTSSVACMKCKIGDVVHVMKQSDSDGKSSTSRHPGSSWTCSLCEAMMTSEAVSKLNRYFVNELNNVNNHDDDRIGVDESKGSNKFMKTVQKLEKLSTQTKKLFHPNHYINIQFLVYLNEAYALIIGQSFQSDEGAKRLPIGVHMRRKEILGELVKMGELIQPGLTNKRGHLLYEQSTCHLLLGQTLYSSGKFTSHDFEKLCQDEISRLQDSASCLATSNSFEVDGDDEGSSNILKKCEAAIVEAKSTLKHLKLDAKVQEVE